MANELVLLTEADRELAAAQSVPELKDLRSTLTAAKAWAKSRGMGIQSENKASEYILRTERKIGFELVRMLEAGERARTGGPWSGKDKTVEPSVLTLSDLGLNTYQSTSWQRLAQLDEDIFEAMLAAAREGQERISKVNFYRVPTSHHSDPDVSETREDPGFVALRAGARLLLGWDMETETSTHNGLAQLPSDELAQIGTLLRALIVAYNEAKVARDG